MGIYTIQIPTVHQLQSHLEMEDEDGDGLRPHGHSEDDGDEHGDGPVRSQWAHGLANIIGFSNAHLI